MGTRFPVQDNLVALLLQKEPVKEYRKKEVIYYARDHNDALYLVTDGRVIVSRFVEDGREVVVDFYHKGDFFGEAGFLGTGNRGERAIALDKKTFVKRWSHIVLKQQMMQTPALGVALLSALVQKMRRANSRIESLCLDPMNRRLVKVLLHLGERFGQPSEQDQLTYLPPMTHELLASYVGTSREIITQFMNQFRRDNLVQYSRTGLDLDVKALKEYLLNAAK